MCFSTGVCLRVCSTHVADHACRPLSVSKLMPVPPRNMTSVPALCEHSPLKALTKINPAPTALTAVPPPPPRPTPFLSTAQALTPAGLHGQFRKLGKILLIIESLKAASIRAVLALPGLVPNPARQHSCPGWKRPLICTKCSVARLERRAASWLCWSCQLPRALLASMNPKA